MGSIINFIELYFSKELTVLITAMLPFIELRGSIPLGFSMGLNIWKVLYLSFIGNIIPIIPLLLILNPVREYLIKHSKIMKRFFDWLYKRTLKKSDKVKKYGAIGLILFTAIPFPTTGAWTASIAAVIFKIEFKRGFIAILIGILIAGMVDTLTSSMVF
ncbi:MAG: small multi-drug export protein [Halanaerobiales bacterium]|nr:small multi-drug export protein [Halanaerobiales bacterium]